MNSIQVRRIVHNYCDRLGLKRFPLHDFRRRFSASKVEGGGDLLTLQPLLGHVSVQSTLRMYPPLDLQVN